MLAKETATELTGANTRMLGAHHKRSVFWEIQPVGVRKFHREYL